jgi:hypothetical protein
MEASEWAQQKVQSIQAAKAADSVRDALNLERQKIRTSNFPELVREVVESFQCHCGEYNKIRGKGERSLDFHGIGPSHFMLRRDAGWSEIHLHTNLLTNTMNLVANRCSFRYNLTYRPEALADGSALLLCSDGDMATPDDVAQRAIGAFLDGREMAERL